MSTVNDGGSAFPCPVGHIECAHPEGMSIRDVFAIGPMSDVELETLREAFGKRFPTEPFSIARMRYWRADTMLEARAQWYSENQAPAPLQAPVVIPPQPGEE